MAKTFKNLPPPASTSSTKRASERDFFDLTDDSQSADTPAIVPAARPNFSAIDNPVIPGNISNPSATAGSDTKRETSRTAKKGNTDNMHNTSIIGNHDKTSNTTSSEDLGKMAVAGLSGDVRQTFVLSRQHLEQLRDHVHARRAGGDYTYSQKQALMEALDLLFASTAPVATRPDQVKEREQERRQRIQQGRLPRA